MNNLSQIVMNECLVIKTFIFISVLSVEFQGVFEEKNLLKEKISIVTYNSLQSK